MIDSVGAQLIGIVSEDDAVLLAANFEVPLILYDKKCASAQFMRIARRLAGEKVPIGKIL